MTEPLTDEQVRALKNWAMTRNICGDGTIKAQRYGEVVQALNEVLRLRVELAKQPIGERVTAAAIERALDERDALRSQLADEVEENARLVQDFTSALKARNEARSRLERLRRRLIHDFYRGTAPGSPRYWTCRVCSWVWENGKPETHESNCPLADTGEARKEGAECDLSAFADRVTSDLGATWEWTPAEPSICFDDRFLLRESLIGQYPWQAKEEVLHEAAHLGGVRGHGPRFYRRYIDLLEREMGMEEDDE